MVNSHLANPHSHVPLHQVRYVGWYISSGVLEIKCHIVFDDPGRFPSARTVLPGNCMWILDIAPVDGLHCQVRVSSFLPSLILNMTIYPSQSR